MDANRQSVWFFRQAVVYAVLGPLLGLYMGISGDFAQISTHAHINLVGWVSMAVWSFAYRAWPALGGNLLAMAHFALASGGVPVMVAGIFLIHMNSPAGGPVVGIGSVIVLAAFACFAANTLLKVRA